MDKNEKLIREFEDATTEQEKWKALLANPDADYVVNLDNDDTFVIIQDYYCEDEHWIGDFSWFIGNAPGIDHLLAAIGIRAEGV